MEPRRKRPEPIKTFMTQDLGNGIINITAPPMRFQQYLVLGSEKALLIDTGFGMGSLKAVIDGLTQLPILLINTHGHPDHGGGNAEFGAPLLHPADNDLYAYKCARETRLEEVTRWGLAEEADKLQPTPLAPIPVEDGTVIDLGDRKLTVHHTPGHTAGSICIFDEQTGYLFTGDNVMGMATALTEPSATSVAVYLASMEKIAKLPVKMVCTGHMPPVISPETIHSKIECARKILAGEQGEFIQTPMGSGYMMTVNGTSVHYTPDKV